MRLQLSSGCAFDAVSEAEKGPRQPAISGKHQDNFGKVEVFAGEASPPSAFLISMVAGSTERMLRGDAQRW